MSGGAPGQPMYVIHERWYMPIWDGGVSVSVAEFRPMSFSLALATIKRWRDAQLECRNGMSDFWMVPA